MTRGPSNATRGAGLSQTLPMPALLIPVLLALILLPLGCVHSPSPGRHAEHRTVVARSDARDRSTARVAASSTGVEDAPTLLDGLDASGLARLALRRDARLAVAHAELSLARARVAVAGAPSDPQIRTGLSRNRTVERADAREVGVGYDGYEIGLRVFPAHPWMRRAERDRETARWRAAAETVRVEEERVLATLRQATTQLRHAEETRAWQARRSALAASRREWIADREAEGQATAVQSALAASAASQARRAYSEAVLERDRRLGEVVALTGVAPEDLAFLTQTDGPGGGLDSPREPHHRDAATDRPQVMMLRARLAAAETGLDELRVRRIPWFSHVQASFDDDDRQGRRDAWALQFAVEIPVFAHSERGRRVAEAEYEVAHAELAAAISQLDAQVAEARATLDQALRHAAQVVPEGELLTQSLRRMRDELADAPATDRELSFQVEQALLETERATMQARFAVERARDALAVALGSPWP